MNLDFADFYNVSNDNLEKMVRDNLREERALLVSLLIMINVMFRRKIYASKGYSSLNDYLINVFGMSRHKAFVRASVSRIIHGHPGLLTMLAKGESSISHIAMIASKLTPANSKILYNAAATMTKRELEAFLPKVMSDGSIVDGEDYITLTIRCKSECADLFDDVAKLIRVKKGVMNKGDVLARVLEDYLEKHDPLKKAERAASRKEKRRDKTKKLIKKLMENIDHDLAHPQSIDIFNNNLLRNEASREDNNDGDFQKPASREDNNDGDFQKPASREDNNDGDFQKPASREDNNDGDFQKPASREEIKKERKIEDSYYSEMKKPLSTHKQNIIRKAIPASIRHQILLRDGGRCTYVSSDGKRCEARSYLQIDHIKMICEGGDNSPGNLRCLCGTHNRLEYLRKTSTHTFDPKYFGNGRENVYLELNFDQDLD